MNEVVILRHGLSKWNIENKFTGWVDVDLAKEGVEEAKFCGKILKDNGFSFDIAYTSYLKRAQKTLDYCLSSLDNKNIERVKDWRLNERHYGSLQGLNKAEVAKKYGESQVLTWRRSFKTRPPELSKSHKYHPTNDLKYKKIKQKLLPSAESLSDVLTRINLFWNNVIIEKIKSGKNVLIVAHGNSLRALSMKLNDFSENEILNYNIPTGVPLVIELNENFKSNNNYFLGDKEKILKKIKQVANQGTLKR